MREICGIVGKSTGERNKWYSRQAGYGWIKLGPELTHCMESLPVDIYLTSACSSTT